MSARPHRTAGPMRRVAMAAALVVLWCVAGCSITTATSRSDEKRELARNRQRWASAGMRDYEYDFRRSCFCGPESTEAVHIVVRNDVVTSVVRSSDGQPASAVVAWPRVDELFDDVRRRLEEGADRLEVEYDPTLGYPRSIVADVILMAVDDEYSLTAGNLRRLP